MRKIVLFPDPVLRQKAAKVETADKTTIKEIEELAETLQKGGVGAGLAAPQIGISKRFFGLMDSKNRKKVKVYINPEIADFFGAKKTYVKMIVDNGKSEDFLEGCLSFPEFFGTVKRWLKIRAVWEEIEEGKLIKKEEVLEGFDALVFQHELDHLEGILFIDHIEADGGKLYKYVGKDLVKWSLDKLVEMETDKVKK